MSFKFKWGEFSPVFIDETKDLLTKSLNKNFNELPPNLVGDIIVTELDFGKKPPVLEILQVVDLDEDTFKAIFNMTYSGDIALTFQTLVQANPLSVPEISSPTTPSMNILMAHKQLILPMFLKISALKLKGIIVLSISKKSGVTLIFKNEPLVSVKVSSSFDNVSSVRKKLQSTIEDVLRNLLREELPKIVHEMSIREINREQLKLEKDRLAQFEHQKNLIEIRTQLLMFRKFRSLKNSPTLLSLNSSPSSSISNSLPSPAHSNFTAPTSAYHQNDLTHNDNIFPLSQSTSYNLNKPFDSNSYFPSQNDLFNHISQNNNFNDSSLSHSFYQPSSNKDSVNLNRRSSFNRRSSNSTKNHSSQSLSQSSLPSNNFPINTHLDEESFLKSPLIKSHTSPTNPIYASSDLMSAFLDDEYNHLKSSSSRLINDEILQEDYIVNPSVNSNAAQLTHLMTSGHTLTPYTRTFENATFRSNIKNDHSDHSNINANSNGFYIGSPTSANGTDSYYYHYPISASASMAPTPFNRAQSYSINSNTSFPSLNHFSSSNRYSKPIKKNVIKISGFNLFSSKSSSQ
ncbi:Mitochondrial distribution and morphology protein 34 [Smittium culicis]|uniref:Mitochondrial distribution and morphology protein 34 n=1 Tax=Smittium culicis TaxID=133412 RepID=A0A1R1Y185_9FUNG|nr:Mitochondrial distribution and morphology protein 34 [Smittium culicis]OMJ20721.1 Mitochondrial distribution and morphology protein 34 [Smittium culicis]